jgi:iron complex transport system permease protein
MIVFLRGLPVMRTLGIVLAILIIALLFIGEVTLPLRAFVEAVIRPNSVAAEIIWGIRLPRNLTAALVGALLGLSGAIMQGLLRNPLAEPGILGV